MNIRFRDLGWFATGCLVAWMVAIIVPSPPSLQEGCVTIKTDVGPGGDMTKGNIGARFQAMGGAVKATTEVGTVAESIAPKSIPPLAENGSGMRLTLPIIRSFGLSQDQVAMAEKFLRDYHGEIEDAMAKRLRREPRFDVPSKHVFGYVIECDEKQADKWRSSLKEDLESAGGLDFAGQTVAAIENRSDYLHLGRYDIELRIQPIMGPDSDGKNRYSVALSFLNPKTGSCVAGLSMGLSGFNKSYAKLFDFEEPTE